MPLLAKRPRTVIRTGMRQSGKTCGRAVWTARKARACTPARRNSPSAAARRPGGGGERRSTVAPGRRSATASIEPWRASTVSGVGAAV